jgi:hypothetical protein
MCSVWISEHTAIISPNKVNWLIFITEKESVYCAVLVETLDIIQVNHSLKGAVKWLRGLVVGLSPRRLGFDSTAIYVRLVVDNVELGQFFSFQYFTATDPQSNFMLLLPEGQRSEACEPSKKQFGEC